MSALKFRSATDILEDAAELGGILEAQLMPVHEREQLCRDLLEEFGASNITTKGDELYCCCVMPDHHDRRPSASLNFNKLTYNCFSCGSGGGLIWFIATCRGEQSGHAARQWVAKHAEQHGGSIESLVALFDAIYSTPERPPPLPVMNPKVLDPWRFIHPWVTEVRHVPEPNVARFEVGYGVMPVKVDESTWVNSHRIVIPHYWRGRLVGWQTRRLIQDGTEKYLNTPDFPRDRTIYNYDTSQGTVVVVESTFSVIRHEHHHHFESTFGSSVTAAQIRLLAHHARVILWGDNDDAGWRMTAKVAEALAPYTEVLVVDSPWAADPADMDDDTVDELIAGAVPDYRWSPPETLTPWVA